MYVFLLSLNAVSFRVSQIGNDLKGKPLKDVKEDKTLAICWKGATPLKSVLEAKNLFKTLTINFKNGRTNSQLQIPPESYLIVSVRNIKT